MHGHEETSSGPRLICALIHILFLGLGAWILFGKGGIAIWGWLGLEPGPEGDAGRRAVLLGFGCILLVRISLTQFHLLKRRFGWEELGGVLFALFLYQVVFPVLGWQTQRPLGVIDYVGVAVFLLGAYLNTGSELQRKRFKEYPANKGKLYTRGLFRLARHINYFGDVLWVGAWALLTRNVWAAIIPVALFLGFVLFFIPSLTRYLEKRYGQAFTDWRAKSKAIVPFVY